MNNLLEIDIAQVSPILASKQIQEERLRALKMREEERALREREQLKKEIEKTPTPNVVAPSILHTYPDLRKEISEKEKLKEAQFEEFRRKQQEKLTFLKKKPSEIVAFKSFPGITPPFPLSFLES